MEPHYSGLQLERVFSDISRLGTDRQAIEVQRRRLAQLRMNVRRVRLDLARKEYNGLSLVFCPDFSEIYSYMYPFSKEMSAISWSFLSSFVFENSKSNFVLPVATLYELNEHVNFLYNSIKNRLPEASLSEIDQYLKQPGMVTFLNGIRHYSDFKTLSPIIEQVSDANLPLKQIIDTWKEFPQITSSIRRLEKLLRKCRPIGELINHRDLDIDNITFESSIINLAKVRPASPLRNRLDSLNHAFVYYLNENVCKNQNFYFLFITHGHPLDIFRDIPWHNDPFRKEEQLEAIPIVRDINHVAYLTMLDVVYPNQLEKQINLIRGLNKQTIGQAIYLNKIRQALQHGQMILPSIANIDQILPATIREMASIEQWNPDLFQAFNDVIETIAKKDAIFNKEFLSPSISSQIKSQSITEQTKLELSTILNKVDEVKKEIEKQISAVKDLAESNETKYVFIGKTISKFDIKIENEADGSREIHIAEKDFNESICKIRMYPKYYSVKTSAPSARLAWFLSIAQYLIGEINIRDSKKALPNVDKYFNGLAIFTSNSKKWEMIGLDSIEFPLDADDLWLKVYHDTNEFPKFIRISSEFMDIWYEMDVKIGQRQNGRVGLISHILFPDLVAHFIARSQERGIRQDILKDTLSSAFGMTFPIG